MKQVKFFLVALMAVVMGMSVTSCMKGENNYSSTCIWCDYFSKYIPIPVSSRR